MKRLLSIVVACLALAYTPGEAQSDAQRENFHRWFAETGRVPCASWRSTATALAEFGKNEFFNDGMMHAGTTGS